MYDLDFIKKQDRETRKWAWETKEECAQGGDQDSKHARERISSYVKFCTVQCPQAQGGSITWTTWILWYFSPSNHVDRPTQISPKSQRPSFIHILLSWPKKSFNCTEKSCIQGTIITTTRQSKQYMVFPHPQQLACTGGFRLSDCI